MLGKIPRNAPFYHFLGKKKSNFVHRKAISLLRTQGETGSTPAKRIFFDNRFWLVHKKAATSLSTLKDASKKVAQNLTNLFAATRRQQTFPGWGRAQNGLWSDRPRQVGPLIRPSQTEVTSDQTSMRSKIIVRSKWARSRLWSDEIQTEWPLIRQVPDHCPDEFQTTVQTRVHSKYSPRLKCGRNHLWSENDFEHEQISQNRYNIFISSIILSILYSTNKKPILKVLLMKINRKKMIKKTTEYAIYLCF